MPIFDVSRTQTLPGATRLLVEVLSASGNAAVGVATAGSAIATPKNAAAAAIPRSFRFIVMCPRCCSGFTLGNSRPLRLGSADDFLLGDLTPIGLQEMIVVGFS